MLALPAQFRRPARRGFTLIELVVTILIVGLLAAIAIPRFHKTRDRAGRSAAMSDLRNLMGAQQAYFEVHNTYSNDPNALDFQGSTRSSLAVLEASARGWSARVTRPDLPGSCAIHVGEAAPVLAGAPANTIWCVE